MTKEEQWMQLAIEQAEKADQMDEVPIGAVVVKDGVIVGKGYNRRETDKNALCHAEIAAIDEACKTLGGWRLWQCELFVTMEPCPMCAGAIINARIPKIYYGCRDPKAGSAGSIIDLFSLPYNHKPQAVGGILEKECAALLTDFFIRLRQRKKGAKQTDT